MTMQAYRAELRLLSNNMKPLKEIGQVDTINEALAAEYRVQGFMNLRTMEQWNAMGYKIKKGSKPLCFWGKPLETDPSFFPVVFRFDISQTEPKAKA